MPSREPNRYRTELARPPSVPSEQGMTSPGRCSIAFRTTFFCARGLPAQVRYLHGCRALTRGKRAAAGRK
jgi:hypothetical protein